jgi:hypothetical protein
MANPGVGAKSLTTFIAQIFANIYDIVAAGLHPSDKAHRR